MTVTELDLGAYEYDDSGNTFYRLTVIAGYGGITDKTSSALFAENTDIVIQATADLGYLFSSWSGDTNGTTNPLLLTITDDTSVTAGFAQDTSDTDGDGLTAYQELVTYGSDPTLKYTKADGIDDGTAVLGGLDPTVDYSAVVNIVKSNPTDFDLFDDSSIQDVRLGGVMLQPDQGGTATMEFILDTTEDLSTIPWAEYSRVTETLTLPATKAFLRVRMEVPAE